MGMAKTVKSPVLLVGDIDRGGVFAQLYGTIALLSEDERALVRGIIINKFRGDKTILDTGIKQLEELVGIPVVGVVPYMSVDIDDEDSQSLKSSEKSAAAIDIAVIRFPKISNYTDFSVFERMDGVSVRYVDNVQKFGAPDMVILPGTKSTMADLKYLRECGLEAVIKKYASSGKPVFGICGGYQMLGKRISDPENTEGGGSMRGMELLPIHTLFSKEKVRTRVSGKFGDVGGIFSHLSSIDFEGYEIHMGKSEAESMLCSITDTITEKTYDDGCQSGNIYGTYVHGIFDSDEIAKTIVRALANEKGIEFDEAQNMGMREYKEMQYDILEDVMRMHLDMEKIYKIMEDGV